MNAVKGASSMQQAIEKASIFTKLTQLATSRLVLFTYSGGNEAEMGRKQRLTNATGD